MIHCSLFRSIKTVWHYAVSSFWWQRSLQQLYYASQGYNCNSFIYNWIVLWLQHQSNVSSWVTSQQQRPSYCFTRFYWVPQKEEEAIAAYDIPIFLRNLQETHLLPEFLNQITGCIDTLKLCKRKFNKNDIRNFKQQNLVAKILGEEYDAHDASADVKSLYSLIGHLVYSEKDISRSIKRHWWSLSLLSSKHLVSPNQWQND